MRLPLRHFDLLVATFLALLMLLVALANPDLGSPFRIVLGLLMLLLVPGYTLMAAVFPHRGDISSVERLTISFGLSIALIPLVGLILSNTPWGIRLDTLTIALAVSVVGAAAVAFTRRRILKPGQRFNVHTDVGFIRGLTFAALSVGMVITLAIVFQIRPQFTAMYLLGAEGQMEAFPNFLTPGEPFSVTIVVENLERRAQSYLLDVHVDEESVSSLEVPRIARAESWKKDVALWAPERPGRHRLTFELFRQGRPEVYRQVHLELMVVAAADQDRP